LEKGHHFPPVFLLPLSSQDGAVFRLAGEENEAE
jgi:hypothetical protein